MKDQPLLEGEEILYTSDDSTILLSNKRIRQNKIAFGEKYSLSIPLENISTIGLHYTSNPALFFLGIGCIIAGVVAGITDSWPNMTLAFIIGGLLLLVYFLGRKHTLTIASNGGARMNILAKGINNTTMLAFANTIENVRNTMKQTESPSKNL